MFEMAKQGFQGPNFFEVATCALWGIWKQRNGWIFEGKHQLESWRAVFKKDIGLIVHRVKPANKEALFDWVGSL
jgi:hypothetical protein